LWIKAADTCLELAQSSGPHGILKIKKNISFQNVLNIRKFAGSMACSMAPYGPPLHYSLVPDAADARRKNLQRLLKNFKNSLCFP